MKRHRASNIRIDWDGYVRGQLAWWVALSHLSRDPACEDKAYLANQARKALENARHPTYPLAR